MNISRFAKAALVLSVVAACMFALVACSNSSGGSSGAAATVNGKEIPEQKVTDQIEMIREQSGLTEEDQWGQFLVENDMTPSSVREQIIDTLTEQELIVQGAADLGITVESSEVDEYISNMKSNYDSDEAWAKALEQAGFTEDSYRETIEESLYEQKVGDHFEEQAEVSDEDYVTQAQTYASYYDGAKRSSHILFGVDDTSDEEAMNAAKAQADEVRAQISAGTLSFEDAVQQYSTDEGSKEEGGDVGWDILNSFVTEYTDALANLEVDQLSDPVESQYGYHIIKVTEVFTAPEDTSTITSLDQIPEAFQDTIKDMAVSVKANTEYTDWLDELKENADIVVNDMPSGLPYDIDLAPYEEAAAAEEEAESDDESEAAVDEVAEVDAGEADAEAATEIDAAEAEATAEAASDAAADAAAADAAAAEDASESTSASASQE